MRTTQAARYARWSATIALLLTVGVGCVYARRAWEAHKASEHGPSSVPAAVEQQSAGFLFSKVAGDRTEFTVHASRATEFKEGGRSVLEDVWITVYGKSGERFDNLHTRQCDYLSASQAITCAGEVRIDLESAADARLHPGAPGHPNPAASVIHIATSQVSFSHDSGVARTDQPVKFEFPEGEGRAIGLLYDSDEGQLSLDHRIELSLHRALPGVPSSPVRTVASSGHDAADLNIDAASLTFDRDERVMRLSGPVSARQGDRELVAGKLQVDLNAELRAQRIVADQHPKITQSANGSPITLSADRISAVFLPAGAVQRAIAQGHVQVKTGTEQTRDELQCALLEAVFTAEGNEVRALTGTGNVRLESNRTGGWSRNLATSKLLLEFASGPKQGEAQLDRLTTPAAIFDWQGPIQAGSKSAVDQGAIEKIHVTGQQFEGTFTNQNELKDIDGAGGIEAIRQIGNAPAQTTSSRELYAHFAPGGEWSSVDQTGDVRVRQGDQTARSGNAHYERSNEGVNLAGSVVLADAGTRTTAQSAAFRAQTNEIRADGNVVTGETSAGSGRFTNLGAGAGRLSADHLTLNTATGHAIYSGRGRLWQGDSVVEAEKIELDRIARTLVATGRVQAIFPQAAWNPSAKTGAGEKSSGRAAAPNPEYWHVQAERMTYDSGQGRGRLENAVQTHSNEGTMRADAMDLIFAPHDGGHNQGSFKTVSEKAPETGRRPQPGGSELTAATALGHVTIDQGDRHGTASRADYSAEQGKFVLSGGTPKLYDSSGNMTTGHQLTFIFSDDTIDVDSAEGSRTLSLHRVEK